MRTDFGMASKQTGLAPSTLPTRFGIFAPRQNQCHRPACSDRTRKYWPKNLFSDGITFSLSASVAGKLAGRTTSFSINGTYSTKAETNLSEVLLPDDLRTGKKEEFYCVTFQINHFLHESTAHPGTGWGLFAKGGLSDGNPNPIQSFFTGGLGGKGLIPGREQDGFGVGYFYYKFSDDLQEARSCRIVLVSLCVSPFCTPSHAVESDHTASIKGVSRPTIIKLADGARCYAYTHFVVFAMPFKDSVGEDIVVYKRPGGFSDSQVSSPKNLTKYMEIKNDFSDYFAGLDREALFIISETAPDGVLKIYDLNRIKKVFESAYADESLKIVHGDYLQLATTRNE